MQVIKNPITDHLPTGCLKIGTSYHSKEMVDVRKMVKSEPIVFVVGAMAHGKVNLIEKSIYSFFLMLSLNHAVQVEVDYVEKEVSISGYPLSAAITCSKLCCAFEEAWGIQ